MQKCTHCKRPIPDGAKFCGHCGESTNFEPNQIQQPPFVQYQVQPYGENVQPLVVEEPPKPKVTPNCDLSVAGFVISLFAPSLCVVSIILCIMALAKKQLHRKLAVAGLIISLVALVLVSFVVYGVFAGLIDITQLIPLPQQ